MNIDNKEDLQLIRDLLYDHLKDLEYWQSIDKRPYAGNLKQAQMLIDAIDKEIT